MARRREFVGIAKAVLASFISRNNDVGGYWGIGRLCRHAQALGVATLDIDLLDAAGKSPGADFDPIIGEFRRMFLQQCEAQPVPLEWLRSARISIRFDGTVLNASPDETAPRDMSFTCSVILEDDTGKTRQSSASGHCWPTDPATEYRRICDDWNRRSGSATAGGDLIG